MSVAVVGDGTTAGRWRGTVPALSWLRSYEPGWFRAVFAAGVTLAAYLLSAALADFGGLGVKLHGEVPRGIRRASASHIAFLGRIDRFTTLADAIDAFQITGAPKP